MSKLMKDAYDLLNRIAASIDERKIEGLDDTRDDIEAWLLAYETEDVEADEVLDRVRRIETRLCILMAHEGLTPQSNGTFG